VEEATTLRCIEKSKDAIVSFIGAAMLLVKSVRPLMRFILASEK